MRCTPSSTASSTPLAEKLPTVAEHLDGARADILAFTAFRGDLAPDLLQQPQRAAEPRDPTPHRRGQYLPDPQAIIPLVGAILAEQHDEWTEGRRNLGLDILTRAQAVTTAREEVTDTKLQANLRVPIQHLDTAHGQWRGSKCFAVVHDV